MRRLSLILAAVVLAACAKKEPATEAAKAPAAAPVAPAPIDLAKVAGTWSFNVTSTASDSVLTNYILVATANTAGWTMYMMHRPVMPLQVMVMGDSIMTTSPVYESVLRKGVKVSTTSVFHLVGDKLIGSTMAHYAIKGPDSLVALRSIGVKAPK
jgi:hypothetical protein